MDGQICQWTSWVSQQARTLTTCRVTSGAVDSSCSSACNSTLHVPVVADGWVGGSAAVASGACGCLVLTFRCSQYPAVLRSASHRLVIGSSWWLTYTPMVSAGACRLISHAANVNLTFTGVQEHPTAGTAGRSTGRGAASRAGAHAPDADNGPQAAGRPRSSWQCHS